MGIRVFIILFLLFVFESCHSKKHNNLKEATNTSAKAVQYPSNSSQLADATVEDKILDKIHALPEVKEKQKFIDSLTKHKSGISMIILKFPSDSAPYYWVQVGYDNSIRFEPYYNFYVYRKGLEIKFFDPMVNKVLSLKEWRKNK